MKIKLICGFKLKQEELLKLEQSYLKRLKNEYRLEILEVPYTKNQSAEEIKNRHPAELLAKSSPSAFKVLLAEDGKSMTTNQLANLVDEKKLNGLNELHIFIGGPYGISKEAYTLFNLQLNISLMTFTAEFCRLNIIEQIYRLQCISLGVPYHKE